MSKYVTLVGGHKMPILGYGTFTITDEAVLESSLDIALETGYRHIDTAELYANEHVIGKTLKKWFDSGKLKREDIFITTKLPGLQPPEKVEGYLKESLRKLQLDYVDLYLIHFPLYLKDWKPSTPRNEIVNGPTDHLATWKKMEEQVDKGRTKTIGVSNFGAHQVKRILENSRIKPAVNQVELHVYLQQPELVKFCQDNGVAVTSFQTFANPGVQAFLKKNNMGGRIELNVLDDPVVKRIADKHKKQTSQILLRYFIQKNILVIPKSVTPSRIRENFNVFDFTLDSDDMKALAALDRGEDGRASKFNFTKAMVDDPEYPHPVKVYPTD